MCENTGLRDLRDLGSSLAIAAQREAFAPAASENFISAPCDKEPSAAADARTRRFCVMLCAGDFSPAGGGGGIPDTAEMIRNPRLRTLWRRRRFALPRNAARVNFHKRGFWPALVFSEAWTRLRPAGPFIPPSCDFLPPSQENKTTAGSCC